MRNYEITFLAPDENMSLTEGKLIRQFENEAEAKEYAEYNITFEEIESIKLLPETPATNERMDLALNQDELKLVLHALAIAEKKMQDITNDYASNVQYVRSYDVANDYLEQSVWENLHKRQEQFAEIFIKLQKYLQQPAHQ